MPPAHQYHNVTLIMLRALSSGRFLTLDADVHARSGDCERPELSRWHLRLRAAALG
jgi:hypothetical protein